MKEVTGIAILPLKGLSKSPAPEYSFFYIIVHIFISHKSVRRGRI
jgi:hypothetical protein